MAWSKAQAKAMRRKYGLGEFRKRGTRRRKGTAKARKVTRRSPATRRQSSPRAMAGGPWFRFGVPVSKPPTDAFNITA